MPNLRIERTDLNPSPTVQRFEVKATSEIGAAVGQGGVAHSIHRRVTIGPRDNVLLIELCMDDTGEVRTYQADALKAVEA